MSNRTWIGGATATAQVWSGVVTDATSGSTYTLTFTDEAGSTGTVVYTVPGAASTTSVATGIAAAVNASTDPRVTPVTASSSTATVTLAADTPGTPFYVTATGGGSGPGAWSGTGNTAPNVGPSDWNWKGNWADNTVPVAGDNVVITGSRFVAFGLDQSAVALAGVTRAYQAGAALGGPGKYLKLNVTGFADFGGGVAYIDFGASAVAPRIAAGSGTIVTPNLFILGSGMTTLTIEGGGVEVAGSVGQTSTVATVINKGGNVRLGSGVTLTTYRQSAGTGEVGCAATTIQADAGTLTTTGSGAVTTMTVNGATGSGANVVSNSSGTITTLNVTGGKVDFTGSDVARTVTTPTLSGNGTIVMDSAVVTLTNKLAISGRSSIKSTAA